jgi:RNA polymerase sigma-70 factor (ECF subfamily)
MTSASSRPSPAKAAGEAPTSSASRIIGRLSEALRPALRRFFRNRRVPREDLDDMVQEVFVRIAGRPNVEAVDRKEAYVFATAANLLRDRHRRMTARAAERHEPYEESVHGGGEQAGDPERSLLAAQTVAQLVEALFELPVKTRTIYALYHLEELSHKEISKRIGVAISTIERHITRANAHILTRIDGI